ncbi:MAG: trehalose-phosphatase [Candidatus Methylomirabilis oxygeniifera]|uniref:Trehalose 6-phosphate phosphatase n=1 Tax=Methylomirabilis oxygeniifera TaxID=671143 RepID=D5MFR0_METO1|nr:MAG: trehalose-phosphatase [Candidatus Methylomirabilis oxyfera]CBE68591.1 putative Trehalose-phosphatase (Trehalose 6-phosphate phosphatase) (TPP) [Candidatus Methylomirabilis oxyfera]
MEQLWSQWPRVAAEIVSSSHTLLLLDYDGTLMRIAPTPEQATLPASIRSVLRALSHHPRITVAVISERPINELRRRVGVRNLIYIGNHGWEMWQVGRQAKVIVPRSFQETVARIRSQLVSVVADIPGVLVEDKGLSVSLHYRLLSTELERHLIGRFVCEILPLVRSSELTVLFGRKIIELCPRLNWIKGHAALWLMKEIHRRSVLPIYIGDDHTDGGAFGALPEGITIQVGAYAGSKAHYYVRDVKEVIALLRWMGTAC